MRLKRKSDGRIYNFKGVENSEDLGFTLHLETLIRVKNNQLKKKKISYTYYYWQDILDAMSRYEETDEIVGVL